jgi:hypothetical protein
VVSSRWSSSTLFCWCPGSSETSFLERCIWLSGPQTWPPGSPDLKPVDIFLRGYVNNKLYQSQERCGGFKTLLQVFEKRLDCSKESASHWSDVQRYSSKRTMITLIKCWYYLLSLLCEVINEHICSLHIQKSYADLRSQKIFPSSHPAEQMVCLWHNLFETLCFLTRLAEVNRSLQYFGRVSFNEYLCEYGPCHCRCSKEYLSCMK